MRTLYDRNELNIDAILGRVRSRGQPPASRFQAGARRTASCVPAPRRLSPWAMDSGRASADRRAWNWAIAQAQRRLGPRASPSQSASNATLWPSTKAGVRVRPQRGEFPFDRRLEAPRRRPRSAASGAEDEATRHPERTGTPAPAWPELDRVVRPGVRRLWISVGRSAVTNRLGIAPRRSSDRPAAGGRMPCSAAAGA